MAKKKWYRDHPKQATKVSEDVIDHQVALEDAHLRHERCKYFGEEIQMDASSLLWFGDKKAHLHLAIDNATGNLVGAYFDWQETLNAYYHVYEQILVDYGIPLRFKTDNRTVFNYETAKTKAEHKDVLTQFGYACKTLGTDIVTTSVSQAKGHGRTGKPDRTEPFKARTEAPQHNYNRGRQQVSAGGLCAKIQR